MSFSLREQREKRHLRVRKNMFGTTERPRLCIFRSGKHLYAQAIDDYQRKTIFAFSTTHPNFRKSAAKSGTLEGAKKLGELFGSQMLGKGIRKIVFDRGGYKYHGRVKALAEALRQTGVEF